jgi:hypothetical protein
MVVKPFYRDPHLVEELDYIKQPGKEPNNKEILLGNPTPL